MRAWIPMETAQSHQASSRSRLLENRPVGHSEGGSAAFIAIARGSPEALPAAIEMKRGRGPACGRWSGLRAWGGALCAKRAAAEAPAAARSGDAEVGRAEAGVERRRAREFPSARSSVDASAPGRKDGRPSDRQKREPPETKADRPYRGLSAHRDHGLACCFGGASGVGSELRSRRGGEVEGGVDDGFSRDVPRTVTPGAAVGVARRPRWRMWDSSRADNSLNESAGWVPDASFRWARDVRRIPDVPSLLLLLTHAPPPVHLREARGDAGSDSGCFGSGLLRFFAELVRKQAAKADGFETARVLA
ncbi:hypothetical protein HPB47_024973 [Ixodes persulcatus]|uniref:Uncharacterized protein n=1 Tax=Ixodes persulcatus TaxID=34615 RepID=A0AC60Q4P3_IXOPE|nr:hypothetical protein HPB47_024973 [Ixodes persulcatus]